MITSRIRSRQPHRLPWTLECLITEHSISLGFVLDKFTSLSTLQTSRDDVEISLTTSVLASSRLRSSQQSTISPLTLEHLDCIYVTYNFYTGLLDEPSHKSFRIGWLEALGDPARYRMAITAMVTSNQLTSHTLATGALSQANAAPTDNVPTLQRASHRSA